MKKIIAICIILFCIFTVSYVFCLNAGFFDTIREVPKNKEKNIQSIRKDMIYEGSLLQWGFDNDGNFTKEMNEMDYNEESWNKDEKKALPDIDIDLKRAKEILIMKREVTIAIIDSDIDCQQNVFKQNLWENKYEIPHDNIDNDNNGYIDDVCGWNFDENNNELYKDFYSGIHGTHIMGILCARDNDRKFNGILANTNVKVMCLKALSGHTGSGKIENVIEAIEYAERNDATICCLSLSTSKHTETLYNVMKKSNMLFTVAVGNEGKKLDKNSAIYPATYNLDNVITVSAVRCDGKISCIANYGKEVVDVVAPGTDIISTFPENQYGFLSGSSVAVPFVSGVAGLLYGNCDKMLSAKEMKQIIMKSVRKNNNLKRLVKSGGIVNAYQTILE